MCVCVCVEGEEGYIAHIYSMTVCTYMIVSTIPDQHFSDINCSFQRKVNYAPLLYGAIVTAKPSRQQPGGEAK